MDDISKQTIDGGDCKFLVCIKMRFIFLNCLFQTEISQSTNMSVSNKFFNREKSREEIQKVINYYIDTNNIAYVDSVEQKKEENDDQVNEDETKKK